MNLTGKGTNVNVNTRIRAVLQDLSLNLKMQNMWWQNVEKCLLVGSKENILLFSIEAGNPKQDVFIPQWNLALLPEKLCRKQSRCGSPSALKCFLINVFQLLKSADWWLPSFGLIILVSIWLQSDFNFLNVLKMLMVFFTFYFIFYSVLHCKNQIVFAKFRSYSCTFEWNILKLIIEIGHLLPGENEFWA